MKLCGLLMAAGAFAFAGMTAAPAQQVDISTGSIAETVSSLRAGQYVWAPQVAPSGPMMLIVNLKTQRALLYRNGIPIGASTVSTGRPGHQTPTGVFTILQKHVKHYSSKYDSAPMPYMERLTWYGVALHAGHLPGYPASHGCIRMPAGFAKLLYGLTSLGMTVVIADVPSVPRVAPVPTILSADPADSIAGGSVLWDPQKAPHGPVSVIVSAKDSRALVLRNGVVIGSAPVRVDEPVTGTWAYALRNIDQTGSHWVRLELSANARDPEQVPRSEWQKFEAPDSFKRAVASILEPGMTIVVTPDSLRSAASPAAVLQSDN